MTAARYITRPQYRGGSIRNPDYALIGSKYAHVVIWREHHGAFLDTDLYIIHHRDHNKRNNRVCDREDGRCPNWSCGNLGAMTRADHIREHRPGRMGGRKLPNRAGKQEPPKCVRCGAVKGSRNGTRCRACYLSGS